jgi:hypothetical protein
MISSDLVMVGYYDYRLVTPSMLISIPGAYAAGALSGRGNWTLGFTCCFQIARKALR